MRLLSVSAVPLVLLIGGCWDSVTQLPGTTKLIDDLPRVANSTAAPCRMQREVAAQNSYIASIQEQKAVTYKAPCDVDKSRIASNDNPKDVKP